MPAAPSLAPYVAPKGDLVLYVAGAKRAYHVIGGSENVDTTYRKQAVDTLS